MVLPNFFILGAAKSGTTSLHDLLKQHPQVYFPFSKEPMFFSQDALYAQGLDWYAKSFFKGSESCPRRGDATPHYLYWAEKVAPRLKKVYPGGPEMIVILRDPVVRAYSWYWNMVREGNESLSFEDALDAEANRLKSQYVTLQTKGAMLYGYVRGSQYVEQIQHFLTFFPREKLLLLLYEDLAAPQLTKTLDDINNFLGIEAHSTPIKSMVSNPAALPRSMSLQRWLRRQSAFREQLKRFIPQKARYFVKEQLIRMNLRPTNYPPMNEKTKQQLKSQFEGEIMKLQGLIGRDLTDWLKA
jgi:hypothetical protein